MSACNIHAELHGRKMVGNSRLAKANEEQERKEKRGRTTGQTIREWGWCSGATYQQEEIISRQATPRMRCTFLIWISLWTGTHHRSCSLPIRMPVLLAHMCDVFHDFHFLHVSLTHQKFKDPSPQTEDLFVEEKVHSFTFLSMCRGFRSLWSPDLQLNSVQSK